MLKPTLVPCHQDLDLNSRILRWRVVVTPRRSNHANFLQYINVLPRTALYQPVRYFSGK